MPKVGKRNSLIQKRESKQQKNTLRRWANEFTAGRKSND